MRSDDEGRKKMRRKNVMEGKRRRKEGTGKKDDVMPIENKTHE